MKLINSFQASCVLALALDDMRPTKGFTPLLVAQGIAKRLNITTPIRPGFRQNVPMPFGGAVASAALGPGAVGIGGTIPVLQMEAPILLPNGSIEVNGETVTSLRVEIAPDFANINIIALTTDDGDQIANAIVEVLEQEFGFKDLKKASRIYASNLVFQFERGLEHYLEILTKIQKAIAPAMRASVGVELDPMFERLTFAFDPLALPSSKVQAAGFIIERRAGVPYSENRYFSGAPIRTQDHIRLLEQIEKLLEGGIK
jgi:hypothetical protein